MIISATVDVGATIPLCIVDLRELRLRRRSLRWVISEVLKAMPKICDGVCSFTI